MARETGHEAGTTRAVAAQVLSILQDLIALSDRDAELDALAQVLTEALIEAEGIRQRLPGGVNALPEAGAGVAEGRTR